jgi:hypothetical protein
LLNAVSGLVLPRQGTVSFTLAWGLVLVLGAASGARAQGHLRIVMTASDIPYTGGQPD